MYIWIVYMIWNSRGLYTGYILCSDGSASKSQQKLEWPVIGSLNSFHSTLRNHTRTRLYSTYLYWDSKCKSWVVPLHWVPSYNRCGIHVWDLRDHLHGLHYMLNSREDSSFWYTVSKILSNVQYVLRWAYTFVCQSKESRMSVSIMPYHKSRHNISGISGSTLYCLYSVGTVEIKQYFLHLRPTASFVIYYEQIPTIWWPITVRSTVIKLQSFIILYRKGLIFRRLYRSPKSLAYTT